MSDTKYQILIELMLGELHNTFKLCGKAAALLNAKIDKIVVIPGL
jgi:hypothetical protein